MSVRFFKIGAVVLLAHLVVFNAVWVGFSAPAPRLPATFVYEGALPSADAAGSQQDSWQKGGASDQLSFDRFDASYFNRWIQLRGPSK